MALDDISIKTQHHFTCPFAFPASQSMVHTFLTFFVFRVKLCLSNYLPFLWGGFALQLSSCLQRAGFFWFHQPKHYSPPRRIESLWFAYIWAFEQCCCHCVNSGSMTHQHSTGFSFAKTGRFGLIDEIRHTWFCIHVHKRTLMDRYKLPFILSLLEIRQDPCYMTQLWLCILS